MVKICITVKTHVHQGKIQVITSKSRNHLHGARHFEEDFEEQMKLNEPGQQKFEGCNVQLSDEIMLISIISLIFIFAHAPVLSNLIYTKHMQ